MIFDIKTAKKTAEVLLQINAIKLSPKMPFTWSSGMKSPVYCDNRIILSFPAIRNYVRESIGKHIEKHYGKPDVIAGIATGAIGIGALIAEYLNLPFIYIRPKAKGHGRKNQIEGFIEKHQNVVVIEDLISTGNSCLNAIEALKTKEAYIKGVVAIFNYGFPDTLKTFATNNLTLNTLCDFKTLIEQASKINYISESDLKLLLSWNENPEAWCTDNLPLLK